ncbi:hypothetical protein BSKO_03882 [Bryopsis sp. KO-2023]|nr:hypothetical protein BSKO_03882 [Bryopsis sp. KO-2023]
MRTASLLKVDISKPPPRATPSLTAPQLVIPPKPMEGKRGDTKVPYGPEQKPWNGLIPEWATVAPPVDDPNAYYQARTRHDVQDSDTGEAFPRIHYSLFQIPPTGLTTEQRDKAQENMRIFLQSHRKYFAGFQGNQMNQGYGSRYSYLLDMQVNNFGDPFDDGNHPLNTKFCERAVLDYFAALWNIAWPHAGCTQADRNKERYWGYVCTMGFTEGNIFGMFRARDYLRGMQVERTLSTEKKRRPVLFFSEEAHFSLKKASMLLDLHDFHEAGSTYYPGRCPTTEDGSWPARVPCHRADDQTSSGSMIIEALTDLVTFFVHRGHPVIVVATLGTTWKGAHDDVAAVNKMFHDLGKVYPWLWERNVQYGVDKMGQPLREKRRGFWLHVDGALGAAYMPFIEMAAKRGELTDNTPPPVFDFRNPAVMSMGCSMHKWMGSPWPSGVFLTRTGYQGSPEENQTPDVSTLGGSRSGFSPVIVWDYLSRMSYDDSIKKVVYCEKNVEYLYEQMLELEAELGMDLWVARSRSSFSVRFRLSSPEINYKWTLDTKRHWVPVSDEEEQLRSYSHVFVMHSVDAPMIDELLADMRKSALKGATHAFPEFDVSIDKPNPGPVRGYQKYKGVCREPNKCLIPLGNGAGENEYIFDE